MGPHRSVLIGIVWTSRSYLVLWDVMARGPALTAPIATEQLPRQVWDNATHEITFDVLALPGSRLFLYGSYRSTMWIINEKQVRDAIRQRQMLEAHHLHSTSWSSSERFA